MSHALKSSVAILVYLAYVPLSNKTYGILTLVHLHIFVITNKILVITTIFIKKNNS